ncbi:MAG: hypothetical protein BJ554DRAFT_5226, partial [Olpidium bornovanus]
QAPPETEATRGDSKRKAGTGRGGRGGRGDTVGGKEKRNMADAPHGSFSPDDHGGGRDADRQRDLPNQAAAATIHQRPASALQSSPTPRSLRSELRVRTNGVSSIRTMLDAASRTSKIILACSLTLMAAQGVSACGREVGFVGLPGFFATIAVSFCSALRFRLFVAYAALTALAFPMPPPLPNRCPRGVADRCNQLRVGAHAGPADRPTVPQLPGRVHASVLVRSAVPDLEAAGSAAELSPATRSPDGAEGPRRDPNPAPASPAGGGAGRRNSETARRTTAQRSRDVEWSNETHERFARARSIVDLTGSILFVWGNYLLLQSPNGVSPPVWNLTLAWVILGYLVVMIPVLLGAAVIFCLPCALVAMRLMRVAEFAGTGAEESEIKKIPVVKFRRRSPPPADAGLAASASSQNLVNRAQPGTKRKWLRKLLSRKKVSQQADADDGEESYLTLPDEDAVCVICLAEYEDSEELRKLLCGHHFHTACADEWLRLSRTCPLCKRDIGAPPDAPAAAAAGNYPPVPAGSTGVS